MRLSTSLITPVRSIFTLVLALIFTLSLGSRTATAGIGVNYPELPVEFRLRMQNLPSNAFVGSEWVIHYQGENMAVPNSSYPGKAELFTVEFKPTTINGLMDPVLKFHGNPGKTPLTVTNGQEYKYWPEYDVYERWGWTEWAGQMLLFYAWSNWDFETDTEYWSLVMTWGPKAFYDDPGDVIDRAQFPTVAGEPRENGFQLIDFKLRQNGVGWNKMILFWDLDLNFDKFEIQSSSDLKTWKHVYGMFNYDKDQVMNIGGVNFAIMTVDLSGEYGPDFGNRAMFRIFGPKP